MRSFTHYRILGTFLLLAILVTAIGAQCPPESSVQPCSCTDSEGRVELTCRGALGLPKLTTILRKAMCGKKMNKFSLIDSDVNYLPSNLFFKVKVEDIQVSFTSISNFTRGGRSAFIGQEFNLRYLSMRRCHLVDNLEWHMIGAMQVLTFLDLAFNDLTSVQKHWFQNPPPRLLSLNLKGNNISTLEHGALSNMHSLIQLDLSENRITTVSRNFFPQPTNNLIFLSLSDNRLKTLPEDMFSEMSNLRRVDLDDNLLETLPEEVWSPVWGDLEKLDLAGNPFNCDSKEEWIESARPPEHLYGIHCRYWNLVSHMTETQTYNM